MRRSNLSAAVAVAFLCLASTQAAQSAAGPRTSVDAITTQARSLGFDQVSFGPDGRQNTMIVNSGTSRARTTANVMRAQNMDQVTALLQGELGALIGLSGSGVNLDKFNTLPDGSNFYRLVQTYRGIPVFADNITVQTDSSGAVQAVFGAGVAIDALDTTPRNSGKEAIQAATNAALQSDGVFTGSRQAVTMEVQPHLVIYALDGHAPTLAWEATVKVNGGSEPFHSRIFADASSGALLANITLITRALSRRVFDANGCVNDTVDPVIFPAGTTLKLSEGGSTAGQISQVTEAYRFLGNVYHYFKINFGRDSYDNAGSRLDGYVRATFSSENCAGGNNAFWANGAMVIGAGGTSFKDLTLSGDVTYHEIGHGVTEFTSGLLYQNQSGGLNEAASDIYGAIIEAWANTLPSGTATSTSTIAYQTNAATWTIGEGLFVANNDPLRWMNDPAADGGSADEFSDYTARWGNCRPTNSNDHCGVHSSSGIANLAFYLMSVGGTHPRGATNTNVTAIGIAKAAKYQYEAHASGTLGQSATFSNMRDAMQARARANSADGGLCDEVRIAQAWAAVEVTGLAPQNANACGAAANVAPVAGFSSTTSGLTATFTDSSTDSDGTIASRSWNFGDGTTSTATNPSKTYTAAGTYSVTLTVTDNAGATNTKTASVTVAATGSNAVQTYTNTTDFTINDNATVDSPITVSGRTGNAPTNATVTVAIVHTWQGDLKVDLVAPDGTLYNIHNRTGGSADNVNKTVTFNLSSETLNGTWKLRVNDNSTLDTGRIDSWSIKF